MKNHFVFYLDFKNVNFIFIKNNYTRRLLSSKNKVAAEEKYILVVLYPKVRNKFNIIWPLRI